MKGKHTRISIDWITVFIGHIFIIGALNKEQYWICIRRIFSRQKVDVRILSFSWTKMPRAIMKAKNIRIAYVRIHSTDTMKFICRPLSIKG